MSVCGCVCGYLVASLNKQLNSQSDFDIKTLIVQAYSQFRQENKKSSEFCFDMKKLTNKKKKTETLSKFLFQWRLD
jgi:hypothetical protein